MGSHSSPAGKKSLLSHIPDISFNYFTAKDVVRHHLVAKIIQAYDKAED